MKRLHLILSGLFLLAFSNLQAQPLWLRYPAISPDGNTIAFGYKGDIYLVDAKGGAARPLTIHEAHDMMPVWSHDGKTIAFASDRYGNFDVFTIPVNGGQAKRLTFHSANDYPFEFSTDDQSVWFGSSRLVSSNNIRFYSPRLFQNLYAVSIQGGNARLITGAGMDVAKLNSKGTQLVFQDRKGYEDPWRKHHTSSVTRDIWLLDLKSNKYKQLSAFEGEDREPVFAPNDASIYYLSEKNGNQNIYQQKLEEANPVQLTQFKDHPVRHLSVSNNNVLCFTYDGSIYTLQDKQSPKLLSITLQNEARSSTEKNVPITGGVSEFALSPNGKEIAFINRGEVFVTGVEGSITKRVTNTPEQERMVRWSPDGKTLIYATERGTSWDIYTCKMVRKEEPFFYASTLLKEEPLIATDAEEFQPRFSPDGKEVAYLENRNVLKVFTLATQQARTLLPAGRNYSYADGDLDFSWSPDGKYLLADDMYFGFGGAKTAVISANGNAPILHPVNSGFGESNPKWGMDGKLITWANHRDGRRSLAYQGSREVDIYALFLDAAAYDEFRLTKDEYALQKEQKANQKKDSTLKWVPDFNGIDTRKLRLTINSASISDYAVSSDGSKIYYLAAFEKGYDLWSSDTRTKETKILAKLGAGGSKLELSKDGKSLFVVNNGSLLKIDDAGKTTPVAINTEMLLDPAAERAYIFAHAWRQVKSKFYDPTIHGINWKMYHDTYQRFLPHISNNYDFQELLSEILGELNASHTGGRYTAQPLNPDNTAALGLLYDETNTAKGIKVTEVITDGPADNAKSKIKPGVTIESIDGEMISGGADWSRLLNRKAGKWILLSGKDAQGNAWEESIKPISFAEESALMYKRWTRKMYQLVDSISKGTVGYVHVQGMNDGSYRTVLDEVMGKNKNKKAIIIDTRFNGGGWLHNDLLTLFSGKTYLEFAPQGNKVPPTEPMDRWQKPSCVLMGEGNYSDAFIFPYIYKAAGVGPLIGMPVPGTGTAVWWETQIDPTLVFGIPMVATIGKEKRPTENLQLEPDIRVPLPYEDLLNGRDTQLEAAIRAMMKAIQ
ncbi:MAG: S41 family peptidase [Bacteroidota bacterium]